MLRFKTATALLLLVLGASLAGCAATDDVAKLDVLSASDMYAKAHDQMSKGNWDTAIKDFQRMEARYPFGPYGLQAQLDLIYCHYRNRDPDSVADEVDRFIKENPRDANVPYAYYMKGMAYFVRHRGPMDWMFNADLSERQTDGLHKSFDAFKQLVARYPDSKYADDARLRMIDLRERLAAFEYSVADYYMRRGAYIGASKRAEFILANYPGTSFVPRALEVLAVAYHRLGMEQLASRASATLRTNYPDYQPKADWSSSADVLPARQASR